MPGLLLDLEWGYASQALECFSKLRVRFDGDGVVGLVGLRSGLRLGTGFRHMLGVELGVQVPLSPTLRGRLVRRRCSIFEGCSGGFEGRTRIFSSSGINNDYLGP